MRSFLCELALSKIINLFFNLLVIYIYIMYKDRKNIGKSIKRKSIKRKSITFSGGVGEEPNYGKGIKPPIVMQLPIEHEIIQFSEAIKTQLISKLEKKKKYNYNSIGWFRKKILTDLPNGCFSIPKPDKFIFDTRLPRIIGLISQILFDNGLPVKEEFELKPSDINVEIHYANAGLEEVGSGLVVHQDNHGAIDGLFHTFIVYLDIECDGGNLAIYDDKGKVKVKEIDVKTSLDGHKNIVMFNGGLYHKPLPITNGKRVIVSYQIRQKDNPIGPRRGGTTPSTSRSTSTSITASRFTPPPGGENLDPCPNNNYEDSNQDNAWAA